MPRKSWKKEAETEAANARLYKKVYNEANERAHELAQQLKTVTVERDEYKQMLAVGVHTMQDLEAKIKRQKVIDRKLPMIRVAERALANKYRELFFYCVHEMRGEGLLIDPFPDPYEEDKEPEEETGCS